MADDATPGHEPAPVSSNIERTKLKERIGMPEFVSCELFRYVKAGVIHRVYHDLESYYWVFVWIVLRHTRHNLGQAKAESVFNYDAALQAKFCWLMVQGKIFGEHLAIDSNTPLTELMTEFKSLVVKMATAHYEDDFLSHEAILKLLDEAQGRPRWPQEDRVEFTYRKPVPQIRVLWAKKSCILMKRSRAAAGIDSTVLILEENSAGAYTGPSTAPQSESPNAKRLKSGKE